MAEPADTIPPCLTPQQVAERLACSPDKVRHMVRSGELPGFQLGQGGPYRVRRDVLQAKLDEWAGHAKSNTASFSAGNDTTSSGPSMDARGASRLARQRKTGRAPSSTS